MLKIGFGNAKLAPNIATFSLPAGYACPGAKDCLALFNVKKNKLIDGINAKFRCYAASQEAVYPSVREARWHNFNLLKKCKNTDEMVTLIYKSIMSLKKMPKYFRIHVSGDFFSLEYFKAWEKIAYLLPKIRFYAYTKSIHFWAQRESFIPANFILIASKGGSYDVLIGNKKSAQVVGSEEEAQVLGLQLDDDDFLAHSGTANFALLLHGNGRSGSLQAQLYHENRIK